MKVWSSPIIVELSILNTFGGQANGQESDRKTDGGAKFDHAGKFPDGFPTGS